MNCNRDNYGFVTFAYKVDAYEAVEHGNDDPHLPKYDLSFGGRRAFCKETYADLGEFWIEFCVILDNNVIDWIYRCCGRRRPI